MYGKSGARFRQQQQWSRPNNVFALLQETIGWQESISVETSLLQGLLPYDLADLLLVQLHERGVGGLPDPAAGDMPTLNYHPVRAADGRAQASGMGAPSA